MIAVRVVAVLTGCSLLSLMLAEFAVSRQNRAAQDWASYRLWGQAREAALICSGVLACCAAVSLGLSVVLR